MDGILVLGLFYCESYNPTCSHALGNGIPTTSEFVQHPRLSPIDLVGSYNYRPNPFRVDFPADQYPTEKFMQILAICHPRTIYEAQLLHRHHQLRARVFAERLGWEVEVVNGQEADAFDALLPTYILAISDDGTVTGCARLLPALGATMVTSIFPSLLPNGRLNAHTAMIESSRFCVDTTLGEGRGDGSIHKATLTMFAGIIEWCMANGYTEIVTVTDLRFERILARVGWPLQRLAEPKKIGVTMAVAGILPANADTFLRLRPTNYHSELSTVAPAA